MCKDCGCSLAKPRLLKVNSHHHLDSELPILTLPRKSRRISVEESIFDKNQSLARDNRLWFENRRLTVFNIMSSPGSGKTTLLCRLLPRLAQKFRMAVIVGDQETSIDSQRLEAAGLRSVQINTHSACHLDAKRVIDAAGQLNVDELDWLVIENVGNLVCPAVFDLGENFRVAVLSTAEGEEKPLKYPALFQNADLIVVTKADLIPNLDYNLTKLMENLRAMNERAPILICSSKTGDGLHLLEEAFIRCAERRTFVHPDGREPHADL